MTATSRLEVDINEPPLTGSSSQEATELIPDVSKCLREEEEESEEGVEMTGEVAESPPLTDSMSTDSMVSCRICKYNSGLDLVPSPCHCKGSMGWVHVSCLEEWLTGSTRNSCELCSFAFNVVRTPKYGYFQSIWIFLRQHVSIVRLLRDVFFLTVSLVNSCILLYMWVMYVLRDLLHILGERSFIKRQSEAASPPIQSALRTFVYFFVFTLCLVFVSANAVDDFRRIFYYYFLPWYHWWKRSFEVKLIVTCTNKQKRE